jgi:hypothetical protein
MAVQSSERLQGTLRLGITLSASFLELIVAPDADFSLEPSVEGGNILFKSLTTFYNIPLSMETSSSSKPVAKRQKRLEKGSTASERSSKVRLHLFPL